MLHCSANANVGAKHARRPYEGSGFSDRHATGSKSGPLAFCIALLLLSYFSKRLLAAQDPSSQAVAYSFPVVLPGAQAIAA